MLLDPAEQEFNLPAPFIESRNLDCRAFEIIGDESNHSAFGTLDPDAPQWNRQTGIAFAGEHDIGIVDDFKAVADGLAYVAGLRLAQARVHLGARDEESVGGVDLLPPAKVIIAFVENVGRTGFQLRLTADLDVIDGRRRNLDTTRDILPWMIDDVHLQAADAAIPFGPFAHLAQRDWARVDQPNHLSPFHPRVSIGLRRQHRESVRENAHRTTGIRTRERRARNLAHPQMIMLMGVYLKGCFDGAQACDPAQLSAHHCHEMIPTFERFVVRIAVMALDDFPKLPSINRFQELPKDAIHVLHARPFSVSRQPESSRFTLDLPGMRCGIVNHSRDSPAASGRGSTADQDAKSSAAPGGRSCRCRSSAIRPQTALRADICRAITLPSQNPAAFWSHRSHRTRGRSSPPPPSRSCAGPAVPPQTPRIRAPRDARRGKARPRADTPIGRRF